MSSNDAKQAFIDLAEEVLRDNGFSVDDPEKDQIEKDYKACL